MGFSYAKSIESLKKDSYLHWFVPLRKLQSDMPKTIHRYPEHARIILRISEALIFPILILRPVAYFKN